VTKPLLSVLIDTFNHEKYIEQCVLSAIEQDFPAADYEIVVVDDGSTDRTPEIVRKFAPRVRLLQKKNGGQASAFNVAFPELRGEIISCLDGDDWFAPSKLKSVASAFEQNPRAGAVSHGHYEFHERTGETKLRAPKQSAFFSLATPEAAGLAWTYWPFLIVGAVTVRKEVFARVVPIPEVLVFCADGPIAWSAMASGTLVLQEPLCYYRFHEANLHTVDASNRRKLHRKAEMMEIMFQEVEPMLIRMGVGREAMLASFYRWWVLISRSRLHDFGGGRRETMQTEVRSFQSEYRNPTLAYRLFRYALAGAAVVLPPRQFYTIWDWWGRQKIVRFPQALRRSGS